MVDCWQIFEIAPSLRCLPNNWVILYPLLSVVHLNCVGKVQFRIFIKSLLPYSSTVNAENQLHPTGARTEQQPWLHRCVILLNRIVSTSNTIRVHRFRCQSLDADFEKKEVLEVIPNHQMKLMAEYLLPISGIHWKAKSGKWFKV